MYHALLAAVASIVMQQSSTISGRVIDDATGRGIADVRITTECPANTPHACRSTSTVSNATGAWRIEVHAPGSRIAAEHIAYATTRTTVDNASAHADVIIRLQQKPLQLETLVVTASRRLERLKDVTIATEVIRGDELRATGASDLAAVLTEHTGMQLEAGHPVGAGVMLQGMGSERVLVLVDGQPAVGRMSGQLDVSRIPTSLIERVEVVKGPQSTLYGTDAMGGVINVITRATRQGRIDGGATLTAGSRGRLDAAADVRGSVNDVAWSLNGGRRTVDLLPGTAGTASTFTTRYDGMAKAEWQMSPHSAMHASALVLSEQQRWRNGALYQFADNFEWQLRAGARADAGRHVFTPSLYATSFTHLARRSTMAQPASPDGERETQRLVEADFLYGFTGDVLSVDAGIDSRLDMIDSDRVSGARRTNASIEPFAQATLSFGPLRMMPGARLTWSNDWGAHFTPRVAAMLHAGEDITLRASIGQGYRAPSFKELHMEFLNSAPGAGYIVRGNASLQPETSHNYSGSVQWGGDRLSATAQVFYNRFDNFIETTERPDSSGLRVFSYGNIQDGSTKGADAELRWSWRSMRAEGGYSYLIARDEATGQSLPGRPAHSGRLALTLPLPFALQSTVSGIHTGAARVAAAADSNATRGAFTRFDVRITRSLPAGITASAGIDNITATTPAHWPGYSGRMFHLGLAWRMETPQL